MTVKPREVFQNRMLQETLVPQWTSQSDSKALLSFYKQVMIGRNKAVLFKTEAGIDLLSLGPQCC